MRIELDTSEMKAILGRLSNVLDWKSDLESFRMIKVDTAGGKLRMSGSVPSVSASCIYDRDEKRRSALEPFGVNGKELFEAIKVLSEKKSTCVLVIDKERISVESGRSKLRMQKCPGENLMKGSEDWPTEGFREMDKAAFCRLIKKMQFVPDGDPNKDMHASTFHINEEHIVTTNRKILAVSDNTTLKGDFFVPFHMTAASAQRLVRMVSSFSPEEECRYLIEEQTLYVETKNFRARVLGAVLAYPPYRTVMMSVENKVAVSMSKNELMTSLRAAEVAMLRHKDTRAIGITFEKGGVSLACKTSDSNYSDVLSYSTKDLSKNDIAVLEKMGEILFDLDLLISGVSSFSSEVISIVIDDVMRPLKLTEEGYEFYISPLRFA